MMTMTNHSYTAYYYCLLLVYYISFLIFASGVFASSSLCSESASGNQVCRVYTLEDCTGLPNVPLLRDVHCPAAWNGVHDILRTVAKKAHAPHYDGYMEFYVDDATLLRVNNTCKKGLYVPPGNDGGESLSPGDAVCHFLTTVTSPGAKSSWWFGALRPFPLLINKLLEAKPMPVMTFGRFSPGWNSLVNKYGFSIEARYMVESVVDFVKSIFSKVLRKEAKLEKHVALSAGGGGGWGGGISYMNGQKAMDFGGGGGGGVTITASGEKNISVDGGSGVAVQGHKSFKGSGYYPTVDLSASSTAPDAIPIYTYSLMPAQGKNTTTACYDKEILRTYLESIHDVYKELKDTYASGGYFSVQGGGGQGAGLTFNIPDADVSTFATGSGFMFTYMFNDPDQEISTVSLLSDPYDELYKELGRIYQEAGDYAAKKCASSTDPNCECHARYEYVVAEAKKIVDPLPSWILLNTCDNGGSSSDLDSCKWINVVQ